MADKDCAIFIGLDAGGIPVGQVHFEGELETATVDVSVAPSHRGKGYASRLLRLAAAALFDDPRWQTVQAWIKPENLAFRQSFERPGASTAKAKKAFTVTRRSASIFTVMSSFEENYIVAGNHPWNRAAFDAQLVHLPGDWHFAATSEEMATLLNSGGKPRYIFFLHWSMRVPDEWVDTHTCVCFHMTDVPYGRGGSPLQNLIQRGHRDTMLTALRMVHEMDAGPVYAKRPLSLEGSAEEIYIRAGRLSCEIIADMVREGPLPVAQSGEAVIFKRRRPEQSAIPADLSDLGALHDFIRMLDAEGYPQAFIEHGGFRLQFNRAALYGGHLLADVKVTRPPSNQPFSAPAP